MLVPSTRWLTLSVGWAVLFAGVRPTMAAGPQDQVVLPAPDKRGKVPLETALVRRRSVREFSPEGLTPKDLGQLLWAAQGITRADGRRTAPSAGALYPIEMVVAVGKVSGLATGVYRYEPRAHRLVKVVAADRRSELARGARGQRWMASAPAILIIGANVQRTARKYGKRADRYVLIEAGHVGQNICLQAVARGLGTTVVGALDGAAVQKVAKLRATERPLVLIPVGHPR